MVFTIKNYRFGSIIINDVEYSRDVVILPDRVISPWWRIEGHRLQIDDVKEYLDINLDAVVIGTGYYGVMKVDDNVISEFKRKSVEVYVMDTRSAVKKYNELVDCGKRVIAFLHLTC